MSIELGNWFVPLLVTVVAFSLAARVRVDAPNYSRLVNRLINLLLIAVAAIASLFVWFAWAMVAA